MDEFTRIARFSSHFARAGRTLALGIGDDAALLRPRAGRVLAATTDTVVSGVHFGPLFRPADIGHKALAVNLSDLAAMGATPRWFLCALSLPAGYSAAALAGLASGMAALAGATGCVLAGGNFTAAAQLAITITALGEVSEALALRRGALQPGDALVVTGALGGAAAGLRRLRAGSRRGAQRQLRPTPRLAAGASALGLARAAIDVSDGLLQDVGHLATASGVGVELWLADLPLAAGATLTEALHGGEDYELVLGVPPQRLRALTRRFAALRLPLTVIGCAVKGRGLWSREKNGRRAALEPSGYQHR